MVQTVDKSNAFCLSCDYVGSWVQNNMCASCNLAATAISLQDLIYERCLASKVDELGKWNSPALLKAIGVKLRDLLAYSDPTKEYERPRRSRSLATLSRDGRTVQFLDDVASAKAEQSRPTASAKAGQQPGSSGDPVTVWGASATTMARTAWRCSNYPAEKWTGHQPLGNTIS